MYRPLSVPWFPELPRDAMVRRGRHALARALRRISARLFHLARSLMAASGDVGPTAPEEVPLLEFHADAGAPEGALYVDGRYVGHLDIRRL